MAAVGVLLVYPFLGFAIAICGAGMVSPRCVAPVCCGFGLAVGVLGQRVFGRSRRGAMVFVVLLVAWVTVREGICARILWEQRQAFLALRDEVENAPADQILIADSSFVLPFYFYAEQQTTREKVVFPIDFAAIHRYEQDDSGEQNLWAAGEDVFPFLVTDLNNALLDSDDAIVARPDGWLVRSLQARGIGLKSYGQDRNWGRVGGVFTPMAHAETRIMLESQAGQ